MAFLDRIGGNKAEPEDTVVQLPEAYRHRHVWMPRVGDVAPQFIAKSTEGPLEFYDWAEGNWVLLFNQPKIGGAVSTSETASLASAALDFARRGVQLMGISDGTPGQVREWTQRIDHHFRVSVAFPIISDPDHKICEAYGMTHLGEGREHAVRKTLLINPGLKVSCVLEYPMNMGRSTEELLRIVDAHQMHDTTGLSSPADWQPGDPALVPSYLSEAEQNERYGGRIVKLSNGIRTVATTASS